MSDLLWNLYLASSTGTTSVSRMYFALGSAAAMTLVLEIAFKKLRGPIIECTRNIGDKQCDGPCLVLTPAPCRRGRVAWNDESLDFVS